MDIDALYLKFLTNTASEQELNQLGLFLRKNPESRVALEKLEVYWQSKQVEIQVPDEEKIWGKLQEKTLIPVPTGRRYIKTKLSRIYQYAAIIIILVLSTALWWNSKIELNEKDEVKVVYITKQNPVRLRRSLTLPDGSKVHLNSESKITYPSIFAKDRVVKLTGEAYFEVVPDKSRPFRVDCYNTSTTVEGTSFNVRGYSNEETVKVSLIEGTVSVDFDEHGQISSYLLEPMQEAIYNKTSGEVQIDLFGIAEVVSWKNGVLYFKKASYEQFRAKIERWYGVTLELSNGITPKWNISGEFHNETIQNVLEVISHAANFEFKISDSKIEITIL